MKGGWKSGGKAAQKREAAAVAAAAAAANYDEEDEEEGQVQENGMEGVEGVEEEEELTMMVSVSGRRSGRAGGGAGARRGSSRVACGGVQDPAAAAELMQEAEEAERDEQGQGQGYRSGAGGRQGRQQRKRGWATVGGALGAAGVDGIHTSALADGDELEEEDEELASARLHPRKRRAAAHAGHTLPPLPPGSRGQGARSADRHAAPGLRVGRVGSSTATVQSVLDALGDLQADRSQPGMQQVRPERSRFFLSVAFSDCLLG